MTIPRSLLALSLTLLSPYCHGFLPSSSRSRSIVKTCSPLPSSLSPSQGSTSNNNVETDDMIRKDIEAMHEEAKTRLESLSHQMDDILKKHDMMHNHDDDDSDSTTFLNAGAFEEAELPVTFHETATTRTVDVASPTANKKRTTKSSEAKTKQVSPPTRPLIDGKSLYGTRWKVVVQVGSQRYIAALSEGGEKPLLVHLVVDFTPQQLGDACDELLQGAGACELQVREAWIGAASMTEGRQRSVKIKSTGGWKVLVGQGPKGIDILRFYIDVEEEICHSKESSSLRCPATRVYCTGGYFSMEHHNEAEEFKNYLRGELILLQNEYDDLILESEKDERLFSFDFIKRNRRMMELKQEVKEMNQKITQARIRDPEKAMLRLSRRGDVGVTKEGQVCYKDDTKGPTSEYLVLGKMEMASINKPIIESSSDPNKLRP